MVAKDLFSAGFAWPADDEVSQTAATLDATREAVETTAKTVDKPQTVASVASVAFYLNQEVAGDECRTPDATPVATPKTTEIRRVEPRSAPCVASVAPVANWSQGVARLAGRDAPFGIGLRAWQALVADAKGLLAWERDLLAAGWSTIDVFGVAPRPGGRRLDCVGLVAVLDRRAVLEIDARYAVIQATPRDRTRFDRTLIGGGGVPVWDWLSGGGF